MRSRIGYMAKLLIIGFSLTVNAQTSNHIVSKAWQAYEDGEYSKGAELYSRAIEQGVNDAGTLYDAACCYALSGKTTQTFTYLNSAVKAGFHDLKLLKTDADLISLHKDNRWTVLLQKVETAEDNYIKSINQELYEMFLQDQADRSQDSVDWDMVAKRDDVHRMRVWEMIKSDSLKAADDYFHAAMILQHGLDSTDYKMAHKLAKKAVALDSTSKLAKWLTAAAWDRYLWSIGKPQWYGTQFQPSKNGKWTVDPIDTSAVTDKQREALNVPTIFKTCKRLKQMNREFTSEKE